MSGNATMGIDLVPLVMIPTADQARSVAFYEAVGFELHADFRWADGHRWIEVYPPRSSTGLSLIPGGSELVGIRTGIILNTGDFEPARAQMMALGIDVDPGIAPEATAEMCREQISSRH
jgi:hypothetical protein